MASETDSDCSSSSSEQERQRKKLHKKLKQKEKKHKKIKKKEKRKEKKHSRKEPEKMCNKEASSQSFKSQTLHTKSEQNANEDNEVFGPALPQHLSNIHKGTERNQPLVIGPTMPKEILTNPETVPVEGSRNEDDNLQGCYGPLPVTNELEMTPAQIELEQRALELKMSALDGINAPTSSHNVREEWMLELPDVGLKSGLAALQSLKRGFHQGKEKPDFSDRSSWTKTPNSGQEKEKPKRSKEDLLLQAEALYEKQRDAEQEMLAKKHKKKHKREESLVEIHQKKLYKEEKRKAKELKEKGLKPERRPFTRDVDLKLNKIDRNQTKQIVDKAKILNTKFSSGHSKYL